MVKGNLNSRTALILSYGLYLAHGGRPEDFDTFSKEDMDIMLASYTAYQAYERVELLKGFAQVIGKLFGSGQR